MKLLYIFFILMSLSSYSQNNFSTYKFGFYNNGIIENKKPIKISVIIEKDTLDCVIKDEQIILPKTDLKCSVLINFKKKNYKIENIDFSKIDDNTFVLFGLEKNLENFTPISNDFPNVYLVKNTFNTITIENFTQAKEVCFISFSSKVENGKKMTVKSYNKVVITKMKNGS